LYQLRYNINEMGGEEKNEGRREEYTEVNQREGRKLKK
jgi:hypothetical protein